LNSDLHTPEYVGRMAEYLRYQYAGLLPRLIYVSDDNALSFARSHLVELFPGVPIFFPGRHGVFANRSRWRRLLTEPPPSRFEAGLEPELRGPAAGDTLAGADAAADRSGKHRDEVFYKPRRSGAIWRLTQAGPRRTLPGGKVKTIACESGNPRVPAPEFCPFLQDR
jgi:hypothetical protein